MKKVKLVSLLLALIMALGLLAGCAAEAPAAPVAEAPAAEAPAAEAPIRIGLSLPTQQEERWVRDRERMVEVAAEMGVELIVMVANANMAEQMSQVESLLSQNIQALILAPHDAAASATLVDKAEEAGVPVIAYDRLITGTDYLDYYISFDNVRVGELQGEFITSLVPEGNYIIMSGAPTDNNARLFKEGAMKYLQPLIDSGAITVVAEQAVENWVPENALRIVEAALLANNNDIQAILAPNDGTAGASIEALAAQGLAGQVPITGQDAELAAAQRIVAGTQTMTIFKDTRVTAKKAVEMAVEIARGGTIATTATIDNGNEMVPAVLVDSQVVTKENLDELLIDSGYLAREDVYN